MTDLVLQDEAGFTIDVPIPNVEDWDWSCPCDVCQSVKVQLDEYLVEQYNEESDAIIIFPEVLRDCDD